jgi:hypothetical protein
MANKNKVLVYSEEQEYKQVRKDLITVISLNAFFFAMLIGLFFFNRSSGKVDHFFTSLLGF